jgi:hypothetical protein
MLPDFERADRIGEFWSYPESRAFAELLTEENRTLRAVLVGMSREGRALAATAPVQQFDVSQIDGTGAIPPPYRSMPASCVKGMGRSRFRAGSDSPHRNGSGRTQASP